MLTIAGFIIWTISQSTPNQSKPKSSKPKEPSIPIWKRLALIFKTLKHNYHLLAKSADGEELRKNIQDLQEKYQTLADSHQDILEKYETSKVKCKALQERISIEGSRKDSDSEEIQQLREKNEELQRHLKQVVKEIEQIYQTTGAADLNFEWDETALSETDNRPTQEISANNMAQLKDILLKYRDGVDD